MKNQLFSIILNNLKIALGEAFWTFISGCAAEYRRSRQTGRFDANFTQYEDLDYQEYLRKKRNNEL